MKKVFLSLTFLSSFSLLAYADGSDSSPAEAVIILVAIISLVLCIYVFWGIYLVFKDEKDAAKKKFKVALAAWIVSIPLAIVGVAMEDSSGTKNNQISISTPDKDIDEVMNMALRNDPNTEKVWNKKLQLYKKNRSVKEAQQFEVAGSLVLDGIINR